MAVSFSYLVFDEITMRLCFNDFRSDKMNSQNSVHHYLSGLYFATVIITGYGISTTNAVLICELSTFLLNMRLLHPTKEGVCYLLINLLFFILYVVFRLIFFPYAIFLSSAVIIGVWPRLNVIRRVSTIIQVFMGVFL